MASQHTTEFRQEAVRVALTSGLSRKQVAADFSVGFSTLSRWIQLERQTLPEPTTQSDLEAEVTRLRKENRLLREERDVLKKSHHILRGSKTMRFRFVEDNRAAVPTERLCRIMNVSSRGYRAFRSRPISQSQRKDMVLLAHIREQHRLSLGSCGRPRMTEELKELGFGVGHRRVGRLMRQNNISVIRTRKHKVTIDSNHKFNVAPNLLNRNFVADHPNQKWPLGDASIACQLTGCRY